MSNAHGIARDQLRAFIERIERLEEEKKTIAEDIKDVYGEAKSMGFDAKILRKVISIRKQDADERAEQEAILDTYLQALGMIQFDMFEEPEAETSAKLVAQVATGLQTQAGRAALLTVVDIMIEREERFDAETGEILDDQTEIATASHGEIESPSATAEASGAKAGGEDVDRSAERANINAVASASGPDEKRATHSPEEATEMDRDVLRGDEIAQAVPAENARKAVPETEDGSVSHAGAGESPATNSIAKPKWPLRPNCRNPEACGGYSDKHCHGCTVAMREKAEELA
ncbi:uncharacterized protein (UPF0335 family) [Sinorhizobium medicae]|uniref:DUF2312 domain-containing protein n=1 Tax=Sinorhizobium medicae TaxID=110321 RepID=UPI00119B2ABC|nr:DUF2312 domain-containing protein [Sinorhizobium medicae]MQU78420.1 DUF2312 domain-containing protein [Sinorhizobium medicae]TWA37362.1 uncharacterized protein (UPF0335 family) [Sinorhizobium medicae]